MTEDQLALLRTIRENPDADLPRLVYADWLEEHGDADRAAFIRLQCELETTDPFSRERLELERQEWKALRKHGERWIEEDGLAEMIAPDSLWHNPPKTRFRRGFVDQVWFRSPDECLSSLPDLLDHAPISRVGLWAPYTIPHDEQQWFADTYLAVYSRLMGLPPYSTHGSAGAEFPSPDEFRRFVHSPLLAPIRSFAMETIYQDRRHLEVLAGSPLAGRLRELDLSGNCVIGEDWAALAESPALAGLRSLRLDRCLLMSAEGLTALVSSPHFGNLQQLSLEGPDRVSRLGPEGVGALCESADLPRLCELNLRGQEGGPEGLRALTAWPGLKRLTRLDLAYFYGGEWNDLIRAWGEFAHSPHWGELRELDLEGDSIEALEAMTDSPNLATLRILTFAAPFGGYEGDDLQNEAAALLARCPNLADELQLRMPDSGFSRASRRLLRDRFGTGLMLFPDSRNRQPGDWSSGRSAQWMFDRR